MAPGLISCLLLPFLVVKDPQTRSSCILVEPHLIDAEFRKRLDAFFLYVGSSCGYSGSVPELCWSSLASGTSFGSP